MRGRRPAVAPASELKNRHPACSGELVQRETARTMTSVIAAIANSPMAPTRKAGSSPASSF